MATSRLWGRHGKPVHLDAMRIFATTRNRCRQRLARICRSVLALEALLGPRCAPSDPLEDRHRDIARFVGDVRCQLCERYGLEHLALAGGCVMNSVANGKSAAVDAIPARLRAIGRRQCRRRDWGGVRDVHKPGGTRSFGIVGLCPIQSHSRTP